MATYHLSQPMPPPEKRLFAVLVATVCWVALYAVIWRIVSGRWQGLGMLAALGAVYFAVTFLWKRRVRYDLEVDDDGLRMLRNGIVKSKVARSRVVYVKEWGTGSFRRLVVSERGPVFTRCLWGGVGVPASLPEYDQIKTRALGWLEESEANR